MLIPTNDRPANEISENPVWQRLVQIGSKRGIILVAANFQNSPLKILRGLFFTERDTSAIVVDSSLAEEDRQFTLAHELIHYIRHRHSGYNLDSPLELKVKNEKEANDLAPRLLWWVKRGLSKQSENAC